VVEVEQALEDWFQYGRTIASSIPPNACLTETTRYWGHEHDYRNNLISVRWGGVVPRRLPCDRKESESLRDGPFSGFRSSSNTTARNGTAGNSALKGEQSKEDALSESDAKVLEGQNSGDKQGNGADGPPLTEDGDGGGEGESGDTGAEAKQDLVAVADHDEDEIDVDRGEGEPFRWQSNVLCVADPFVETKNLAGPIRPNVIVRFREDCQRVVMRLRMGGNLDSLLWFNPCTVPGGEAHRRRREEREEGGREGRGPSREVGGG